jgi:hypothetical protein
MLKCISLVLVMLVQLITASSPLLLHRRHFDENESPADELEKSTLPIHYNGGEIMTGPLKIRYIFYGKFKNKTANLLEFFATHLGKSEWWGITRTYHDGKGNYITDDIKLEPSWYDDYSIGKDFKKRSSPNIILQNNLKRNGVKADPKTLYAIIFSKDVNAMEFCSKYCGFHRHVNRKDKQMIKYAVVMDTTKCPGSAPMPGQLKGEKGCLQKPWRNTTMTLNGDQSADGIINILAHEISEAVTDPASPGGWTDGWTAGRPGGRAAGQADGLTDRRVGAA